MNPFPIGTIEIGASPIALSTLAAGKPALMWKLTVFNTGSGTIYIGSSTMDISTLAGIVAVIPAGRSYSLVWDYRNDLLDWQQYSIHGTHATDVAVVTGQTVG